MDEQVRDPRAHEALTQKMKQVTAERDIRTLEQAVQEYTARYTKPPRRLQDVVAKGLLTEIPAEPLGGSYILNPDGTITATGLQERLKIYRVDPCQKPAAASATS
jgi:hypothetical protein